MSVEKGQRKLSHAFRLNCYFSIRTDTLLSLEEWVRQPSNTTIMQTARDRLSIYDWSWHSVNKDRRKESSQASLFQSLAVRMLLVPGFLALGVWGVTGQRAGRPESLPAGKHIFLLLAFPPPLPLSWPWFPLKSFPSPFLSMCVLLFLICGSPLIFPTFYLVAPFLLLPPHSILFGLLLIHPSLYNFSLYSLSLAF